MLAWLRNAFQAATPEASPESEPRPVGPGSVLSGRYELVQRLGRGGAGAVYRARDLVLEQDVAVKVLRTDAHALLPDGAIDLRREAQAAMRLSHPGIARVHTYDLDGDVAYLVMEFIDGATLTRCRRARTDGRLPLDVVGPVIIDVLDALACAHDAGLVHNDINPANIMITRSGQVKLLDFGLAGASRASDDTGSTLVGTPAYLSPERIAGTAPDGRSDLYSLAAVFFTMVDGQPPFGREAAVAVAGHTSQPVRRSPHMPPAVAAVVRRAMSKQRNERYSSARAMADALREALATGRAPAASVLRVTTQPIVIEGRGTHVAEAEARSEAPPGPWSGCHRRRPRLATAHRGAAARDGKGRGLCRSRGWPRGHRPRVPARQASRHQHRLRSLRASHP